MKLTVSSTAMMKPLLHTKNQSQYLSPPQRVTGLLEINQVQPGRNNGRQKLVQYRRPDPQCALPTTARWQEFLRLDNVKNISCAAVFGFEFDGTRAWYQLWNRTTNRTCWLLHDNEMNYEPFAILTMDALVSLLPNWDGTLHQSPDSPDGADAVLHEPETIDARRIINLLIFDASTNAAGQLWFLVTINTHHTDREMITTQSGWISRTIQT